MLFSRFFRRAEAEAPETANPSNPNPGQDAPAAAPPSAAPPTTNESNPQTDNESELFAEMERIIGEGSETIRIPCRALLAVLPEPFQGEAYRADAIPDDVCIELDRTDLLNQLSRGQVVYPLDALSAMVPPGWVKPDADTLVELNLPDVVEAIPPDVLRGSDQLDEETIEVAQMRDYFRPEPTPEPVGVTTAPVAPAPPAADAAPPHTGPEPETAPRKDTVQPKGRAKPVPPAWAWDGVERGRDAGAQAIDINRARIEDFERIPGLGRVRAERILAWRENHGPFKGIYDLADMPGVGRKLFLRMTGLNPAVTKRKARHTLLNGWLGLAPEARPGLALLMAHIRTSLSLSACVLADAQGVVLAQAPESDPQAPRLAALTPKLFRRIRKYLPRIAPGGESVLFFPTADIPLVLIRSGSYYLCVTLPPDSAWQEAVGKLSRIGIELEWLLGPRLVVHGPSAQE